MKLMGIVVLVECERCGGNKIQSDVQGYGAGGVLGLTLSCSACGGSGKHARELTLLEFAREFKGFL